MMTRRKKSCEKYPTDNNQRPFKCDTCGRGFYRMEHKKRHLKIHTGEKLYICNHHYCAKRFGRSDELRRHLKTHVRQDKFTNCTVRQIKLANAAEYHTFAHAQSQSPTHQNLQARSPLESPKYRCTVTNTLNQLCSKDYSVTTSALSASEPRAAKYFVPDFVYTASTNNIRNERVALPSISTMLAQIQQYNESRLWI